MRQATELLDWDEAPSEGLDDSNPPFYKWFADGKLNASANCLDRHVEAGRGDRVAYHWRGEEGEERDVTYAELLADTQRFANALKDLGVEQGRRGRDLPADDPRGRRRDARLRADRRPAQRRLRRLLGRVGARADGVLRGQGAGHRRRRAPQGQDGADQAAGRRADRRPGDAGDDRRRPPHRHRLPDARGPRRLLRRGLAAADAECPAEPLDAEHPLFILYTSGSTAKPKGILHTTGGYLTGVAATHRYVFDLKPESDVYWCAADVGWVTGHSYIVYGPLLNGATSVMWEGAPDYPSKGIWWELVERYGVTILYAAPTAIRTFIKWGADIPAKSDLSSLRLLGSVGEPINPKAWLWYHKVIGGGTCPIVDTWWQTETGAIMITPLPGITATKPGSATRPFPGVAAEVVGESDGEPVEQGQGLLILTQPWPSMLRTLYKEEDRFVETYFSRFGKETYLVGDAARHDEDGYFWVIGRIDDVVNVSGHRLSTAEVESAIVAHPKVAEAAVIGQSDEHTGQAICAFVTLRGDTEPSDELVEAIRGVVAERIGKFARPKRIVWADELPKTRSGKIMRRLLRDIAEGRALGDVTTLRDPGVMEELEAKIADYDDED